VTRRGSSLALSIASPLAALAITIVAGALLFSLLGKSPGQALALFFIEPVRSARGWSELAIKATPLLLIALGLAVSFRANVWNIGAEGQFIAGAIAATWVALQATEHTPRAIAIAIVVAGALGGMVWGGIVAVLRDRFHASEILVSLMLVYVAELLLGYVVHGPWKDPNGFNFPQTASFPAVASIPRLVHGYRAHVGLVVALGGALAVWLFVFRSYAGFQLEVGGSAPRAARYAGFSARRALWTALLVSGGLAGMAGALEVAGPIGQLTPHFPVGYGFAAIIVAFVGRLHPFGIVFAALLMSMFYIGGELVQSRLGLPRALTGVFQGLLLFALLACDAVGQRLAQRLRRAAA
jgi:simple sugar transport system permease protein